MGEEPSTVPTERGDYRRFYEQFRDAVRTGSPPPVDPLDAIRGLRVLEAAETSSRTASVVSPAAV
jgi:predicted dehydrogenase